MLDLILGAALSAQQPAAEGLTAAVADQETADRNALIYTAPNRGPLNLFEGADFALNIDEKKSEATFSLAWVFDDRDPSENRRRVRISRTTLNLGLTLPVGGADNLFDSGTFDAFAEGPTITFGLSWYGWTSRAPERLNSPAFRRLMDEAVQRCLENPGEGRTRDYCEPYRTRNETSFAEQYTGSPARVLRALGSPANGFGIQGELGFDRFEYRTPLTLAENSRTEPNFSATAAYFHFPADGVSLFSLSLTYENHFKARDEEILCRPVVADPNDDCVNAPSGPPRNVERLAPGVEYRRNIGGIPGLGSFGIAPQASYDVIGDHYRLELPIYLTPEGDPDFLPGISLAYDSEDHDFVIGLFLRKRFSLGR
ncbi:MAG TPA: hypothetical protein VGW40_14500 [Allosphingosinicella sp.]|nr:hypothetical protein [Allosphingosinicella sp.]